MEKRRNYTVEFIRALAIIIVVAGHSMILYSDGWNVGYNASVQSPMFNFIKRYINIIQMPLFMSISGYCFLYSTDRTERTSPWVFFKKKIKRIAIPFLAISYIWMIPIRLCAHYPSYQNKTLLVISYELFTGIDSGHLWYLPTLFFLYVIYYTIQRLEAKYDNKHFDLIICLLFAFAYILYSRFPSFFFLQRIIQNAVWFCMGVIIHKHYQYKQKYLISELLRMGGWVFVFMGFSFLVFFDVPTLIRRLFELLFISLALILLYAISIKKNVKGIELISNDSFGIYLFHSPLIYLSACYLSKIRPVYMFLLNIIVGGLVSILLVHLIRKIGLKVLIGE